MPSTGLPATRPNTVGLPGFTATPWKITSPRAFSTSRIRSRSPTELPPENTRTSSASAVSIAADSASSVSGADGRTTGTPP
jgi:hypothetical protein